MSFLAGGGFLSPPPSFRGVDYDWTFSTADAVATLANSWGTAELPANCIATIESYTHAWHADGSQAGGLAFIVTFKKLGGALTLVQTVTPTHNKTTGPAYAVAITAAGGAIVHTVTGIAATAVRWWNRTRVLYSVL